MDFSLTPIARGDVEDQRINYFGIGSFDENREENLKHIHSGAAFPEKAGGDSPW